MKTIDHYHSIAESSQLMLDAARAGDWDGLVSAEEECARRIAALQRHQESPVHDGSNVDRTQRMNILSEILARDAQIRDFTTPWLRQLEQLLSSAGRDRQLGNTYRSDFG